MSLVPHSVFPRSLFDTNNWLTPSQLGGVSTLDLFDPFDELDHLVGRNFQWLNRPEFLNPLALLQPKVPQKYRITVDATGYSPQSIKTEWVGNQLVVSAREEDKVGTDYSVREFKKTYDFPPNAEHDKLVSFFTGGGGLVLEVPLRETADSSNAQLFPQIVNNADGSKSVQLNFSLPSNIDPSHVHVSVKDRDLIVRAEDRVDRPDRHSRFHYYKRTTLPENTKFDDLKVVYDNSRLAISAPVDTEWHRRIHRNIPIDVKTAPQAIKQ